MGDRQQAPIARGSSDREGDMCSNIGTLIVTDEIDNKYLEAVRMEREMCATTVTTPVPS